MKESVRNFEIKSMSHFLLSSGMSLEEALNRFKSIRTKTQRAWLERVYFKVAMRRKARELMKSEEVKKVVEYFETRTSWDKFVPPQDYPVLQNSGSKLRRAYGWKSVSRSITFIGDKGLGYHKGKRYTSQVALASALPLMGDISLEQMRFGIASGQTSFTGRTVVDDIICGKNTGAAREHTVQFTRTCAFCDSLGIILDNYKGEDVWACPLHVRNRRRASKMAAMRWWRKKITPILGVFPPAWRDPSIYTKLNSARIARLISRLEVHSTDLEFRKAIRAAPFGAFIQGLPLVLRFFTRTKTSNSYFLVDGQKIELPRGITLRNTVQLVVSAPPNSG